jgi:hypothetical protein
MIVIDALIYYGEITDKFKDANGKIVYIVEGKEFRTTYDFCSVEVGEFAKIVVDVFDEEVLVFDRLYKDFGSDKELIEEIKKSIKLPV